MQRLDDDLCRLGQATGNGYAILVPALHGMHVAIRRLGPQPDVSHIPDATLLLLQDSFTQGPGLPEGGSLLIDAALGDPSHAGRTLLQMGDFRWRKIMSSDIHEALARTQSLNIAADRLAIRAQQHGNETTAVADAEGWHGGADGQRLPRRGDRQRRQQPLIQQTGQQDSPSQPGCSWRGIARGLFQERRGQIRLRHGLGSILVDGRQHKASLRARALASRSRR